MRKTRLELRSKGEQINRHMVYSWDEQNYSQFYFVAICNITLYHFRLILPKCLFQKVTAESLIFVELIFYIFFITWHYMYQGQTIHWMYYIIYYILYMRSMAENYIRISFFMEILVLVIYYHESFIYRYMNINCHGDFIFMEK